MAKLPEPLTDEPLVSCTATIASDEGTVQLEFGVDGETRRVMDRLFRQRNEWHRKHTRSQIVGGICVVLAFIAGKVL